MYMNERDTLDLIDFIQDHREHFDAVPCEFETRDGVLIPYDTIWDVYCKYVVPFEHDWSF